MIKDISTENLLKELDRREKKDNRAVESIRINSTFKKLKLIGAVEYELSSDEEYGPTFTLGILKRGKFNDFYYNSGLKYEEYQKLIPSGFCETMESTYEFKYNRRICNKKLLDIALGILKRCGYTHMENITNKYE